MKKITLIASLAGLLHAPPVYSDSIGLREPPQVEAVIWLKDIHQMHAASAQSAAVLRSLPIIAEFLSPKKFVWPDAIDWTQVLGDIAALGPPSPSPMPIAIVAYSDAEGIGAEATVATGATIEQIAALAMKYLPQWEPKLVEGRLHVRLHMGLLLQGEVQGGVLRFTFAGRKIHRFSHTEPALPEAVTLLTKNDDLVVCLTGGGTFSQEIAKHLTNPFFSALLASLNGVGMSARYDGREYQSKMFISSPMLAELGGQVLRGMGSAFTFADFSDAPLSLMSLALPGGVTQGAGGFMALNEHTAKLAPVIQQLDGRAGMVHFGPGGDWVWLLGAGDAKRAQDLERNLSGQGQELLPQILSPRFWVDDVVDGISYKHWRPHETIQGWHMSVQGDRLRLVGQRARLHKEIAARSKGNDVVKKENPDFLTPAMRELMQRPAIVRGYTVLGGTPDFWESLAFYVAPLLLWAESQPNFGESLKPEAIARMPLLLAALGYLSSLTYDVGMALWADGENLVLEMASSEI